MGATTLCAQPLSRDEAYLSAAEAIQVPRIEQGSISTEFTEGGMASA